MPLDVCRRALSKQPTSFRLNATLIPVIDKTFFEGRGHPEIADIGNPAQLLTGRAG